MKYLKRASKEVAYIAVADRDYEIAVTIQPNFECDVVVLPEDVDVRTTADELLISSFGEGLIIGELVKKSFDRTFYVYYDRLGLRITENQQEAPEGALVVDGGEFFVHRIVHFDPPDPIEALRLRRFWNK